MDRLGRFGQVVGLIDIRQIRFLQGIDADFVFGLRDERHLTRLRERLFRNLVQVRFLVFFLGFVRRSTIRELKKI